MSDGCRYPRAVSAALLMVPRDWRPALAHDLEEEARGRPTFWFAMQVARAGLRLRVWRAMDRVRRRSPARPPRKPRNPFADAWRDVRLAVRRAASHPGYSLGVIGLLALGIGANTAIYSVFNHVLFRPLPGVAAPSALVTMKFQEDERTGEFFVSYLDYVDLRDGIPALSGLSASAPMGVDLAVPGVRDPQRTEAEIVTANYFGVFGVAPAPGRDFQATEERPSGSPPPAIISRRLWRSLFEADPSALGRSIVVNGHTFIVVGIAPAGFQGKSPIVATDIWLPLGAHPELLPSYGADVLRTRRVTIFGSVIGRVRTGIANQVVQEQAVAARNASADFMGGRASGIGPVVYQGVGLGEFATSRLALMFKLLMGAVTLVLLLACANAANLLLARALGRRREIALCQAIGASRFRIVRQQLIEGLVLATAAGALGLVIATGLMALFDGMPLMTFLPEVRDVTIDVRVLAFATLASLATGVFFAAVPALVSSRVDLQSFLKDGLTASRTGRRVLRAGLATFQMAICVVLLVGAGLFARTLGNIRALDIGMSIDGVVSYSVEPLQHGILGDRAYVYFRDTLERLRSVPGFSAAAYSWTTPYQPQRSTTGLKREGDVKTINVSTNTVSPGFFETLGIPLVAGRDFMDEEAWSEKGPGAAIVSEQLARELWPGASPLGSRLVLQYPKDKVVTIVGVVGDVRGRPLTEDPKPYFYLPARNAWGFVHVRSALPFAATVGAIRDVARELNPNMPPHRLERFGASIDRLLAEQRVVARLSGLFAGLAIVLAGMGLYAMMAGAVNERKREFGIRMALGAPAQVVLQLVMRSSLAVTAIGIATGLAAAYVARRVVESRLYGVSSADPLTLAVSCALLMAAALAASVLPAWRAMRVDPIATLRVE